MSEKREAIPETLAALYDDAFVRYGTHALWSLRQLTNPGPDDALVVARALRIEGDRQARGLAELIEKVCRASV